MIFNRQLYKQKPSAWGPVSNVQASIFKNAERIGIDPVSILLAMPMWDTRDYGPRNLVSTKYSAPFQSRNAMYFDGNDDAIGFPGGSYWIGSGTTDLPISVLSGFQSIGSESVAVISGDCPTVDVFGNLMQLAVTTANGIFWGFWGYANTTATVNSIRTNTTDLTVHGKGGNIVCTYSGSKTEAGLKTYYAGKQMATVSASSGTYAKCTPYTFKIAEAYGNSSVYHNYYNQYLTQLFVFRGALPASQSISLTDNPYFLLQRVPPVFYSVPGGEVLPTFNPLFLNAAQPTRVIQ